MSNYSRNLDELKCRLCGKWHITKEYFRKVKEVSGLAPNCPCQSGSGDIGGHWVEVSEMELIGNQTLREEILGELPPSQH